MLIREMKLGDSASVTKTVTETDVYLFAGITGDLNPAHTNEVSASQTQFGGRIAHGILGAGFISAVLGMKLPGPGTIYLGQELKFTKLLRVPVRFFLKGPRPLRWCRHSLSQGVRRVKGGGVLWGEDGDGDAADTGAGVLDGRVPGHADHRYPTVYWMLPQKKRDRTQSRGIQMGKGGSIWRTAFWPGWTAGRTRSGCSPCSACCRSTPTPWRSGTRHCPKRQGGGSSARLTGRYPTIYTGWF